MSKSLQASLSADLALAQIEVDLLRAARELHLAGFTPRHLRPTQMAAVEECLRTAATREAAVAAVRTWMARQLEKLEKKEARGGRPSSWRIAPAGEGAGETAESLGRELLRWLTEERYLPAKPLAGLDRLAALQRFWERFHGLYRYQKGLEREMPLSALHLPVPPEEEPR